MTGSNCSEAFTQHLLFAFILTAMARKRLEPVPYNLLTELNRKYLPLLRLMSCSMLVLMLWSAVRGCDLMTRSTVGACSTVLFCFGLSSNITWYSAPKTYTLNFHCEIDFSITHIVWQPQCTGTLARCIEHHLEADWQCSQCPSLIYPQAICCIPSQASKTSLELTYPNMLPGCAFATIYLDSRRPRFNVQHWPFLGMSALPSTRYYIFYSYMYQSFCLLALTTSYLILARYMSHQPRIQHVFPTHILTSPFVLWSPKMIQNRACYQSTLISSRLKGNVLKTVNISTSSLCPVILKAPQASKALLFEARQPRISPYKMRQVNRVGLI